MRLIPPLIALIVAGLALPAMDCGPSPYPTDQCIKLKLDAVAGFCEAAVTGPFDPQDFGAVEGAWQDAEALSLSRGVDCSVTTVSALQMGARIVGVLPAFEAAVTSGLSGPAVCEEELSAAAGALCGDWLKARASHFVKRDRDRDRALLDRDLGRAIDRHNAAHQAAMTEHGCSGVSAGTVQSVVAAVGGDVLEDVTIAPGVAQAWAAVVPGPFEYEGRSWDPACWDGAEYRFFVKKGTVNKVLVNYEGGGACWDIFTCGLNPTFKQGVDPNDHPGNFPFGFADDTNPDNPFKDWHKVYIPYCTGDIHWGDATVDHQQLGAGGEVVNSVTVRHQGFTNTRAAEKWLREHFAEPEALFVTGSSAGAYGAIGNAVWLMEKVFPSTEFSVLGDAGNGVVTQDFLENEIDKWNVDTLLPPWIPALNVPLPELSVEDLYADVATTYPNNRFATYTSAFDGGGGGQTGFYHVMLNPGAIFAWPNWWNSSCAWNQQMQVQNEATVQRAPNYRFYVGTGSAHTTFFRDRVYEVTEPGSPTVAAWAQAMVDGTPDWTNVSCTDCGVLLDGDPRPNPAQPPFTPAGIIDCSGVGGP